LPFTLTTRHSLPLNSSLHKPCNLHKLPIRCMLRGFRRSGVMAPEATGVFGLPSSVRARMIPGRSCQTSNVKRA
jgi:hypothetical protein